MKSEEAYSILDIVSESEGQGVVLTYAFLSNSGNRNAIP